MIKPNSWKFSVLLGIICAYPPMSTDIYLVALPSIQHTFQTSHLMVQLTLGMYFLAFSLFLLIWGPISDAYGRKPILMLGTLLFGISSICCALTQHIEFLILWRFVQGASAAAGTTAAYAMIKDLYPPQEARKVISNMLTIIGIAPIIAPLIGSFLFTHFGWTAAFYFLALYAIVLLIYLLRLQETHPNADRAISAKAFLSRYRPHLSNIKFLAYVFSGACNFGSMFIFIASAPFLYLKHYNLPPLGFALLFALNASAIIISAQISAYLNAKVSSRILINTGFIGLFVSLLILLGLGMTPFHNLTIFVIGVFVATLGIWLATPNIAGLTLACVTEHAGTASGIMNSCRFFLGLLSTIVVGLFAITPMHTVILMSIFGLCAILFYAIAKG